MTDAEFAAFAREIGARFRGTETRWIMIVLPPGSYTGQAGPHTAANMPTALQVATLRGIANSLESNPSCEITVEIAPPKPEEDG